MNGQPGCLSEHRFCVGSAPLSVRELEADEISNPGVRTLIYEAFDDRELLPGTKVVVTEKGLDDWLC